MAKEELNNIASLYIDLMFADALFIAAAMKDFEIMNYREEIKYRTEEHSKFEPLIGEYKQRYSSQAPICLQGNIIEDIKGYYRNIISFLEKRDFEGLENLSKQPYDFPNLEGRYPF